MSYININKNKSMKALQEQHQVFFRLLVLFIRKGKEQQEVDKLKKELLELTGLINARLKW